MKNKIFTNLLKKFENTFTGSEDLLNISIASELADIIRPEGNEDIFDDLCNKIKECILEANNCSCNASAICNAISFMLQERDTTLEDILEMSNANLINEAHYYL